MADQTQSIFGKVVSLYGKVREPMNDLRSAWRSQAWSGEVFPVGLMGGLSWRERSKEFFGATPREHLTRLFVGPYEERVAPTPRIYEPWRRGKIRRISQEATPGGMKMLRGWKGGRLYRNVGIMFGAGAPVTLGFALTEEGNSIANLLEAGAMATSWTVGAAAGAALGTAVMPVVGPAVGWLAGGLAANVGLSVIQETTKNIARMGVASRKMRYGPVYVDTEAAYSMRQRSINIMRETAMNTRFAMGNEAKYTHM